MKRFAITLLLLLAGLGAHAQLQYTVPQSDTNNGTAVFNAVTTAQSSGCLRNEGQNIWFSTYTVSGSGASLLDYRLEYSFNSDAATCTTGTWFPFSDDATDQSQGQVQAIGSYPFIRANLVAYGGNGTFTSFYTTSSASPPAGFGFYNPTQQIRKVIFSNVNDGIIQTTTIPVPYGSTAGFVVVQDFTHHWSGSATVVVKPFVGKENWGSQSFSLSTTVANGVFSVPPTPTSSIIVSYTPGTTTGGTLSAYYIFTPPGSQPASAQPQIAKNTESTSSANAAVSATITPANSATGDAAQSVYIYSVSARCSAGTAQLTISDSTSSTQIWSTAAGEVGTTTFKYQWVPGLDGSLSLGDAVQVTLGTCGPANTGTLDVQASVF